MVTNQMLYRKYGNPGDKAFQKKWLTMWDVPTELEIGVIPKRIYCNVDMVQPLTKAFTNLIERGFVKELLTWDGCYNLRPVRGYEDEYEECVRAGDIMKSIQYLSNHSWGTAVDNNQAWNQLNKKPTASPGFVQCWIDAGFDWGGSWKRLDGMHYQLSKI